MEPIRTLYENEGGCSDTLRLVAQEKFRELLLGRGWKDLHEYLRCHGDSFEVTPRMRLGVTWADG